MTVQERAKEFDKELPEIFNSEIGDEIIIPDKWCAQKLFGITLAGFTLWAEREYKEPVDQVLRKMNSSISFVESMIGKLILSKRVPDDMTTQEIIGAINYILKVAKEY